MIVVITLYSCLSYVGTVTGGCLNPAVGIGLIGMGTLFKDMDTDCYTYGAYIHIIGPLLGGALAGVFYMLVHYPVTDKVVHHGSEETLETE